MLWYQRATIVVGAVITALLQIFLASHIAIGPALPNFMVAYCAVVAVMNPRFYSCILPFVLGLVYDIVSGGPVGAMTFTLTAFSVSLAWFCERMNNDTVFMGVINLAVGVLVIDLVYGVFLLLFGYGTNPIEVLGLHMLPCFVYDVVLAEALYLIVRRFFTEDTTSQPVIKQLS